MFEEWSNKIIPQGTNLIFEKHLGNFDLVYNREEGLQERGDALVAVVAKNSGSEATEGYVRIYLGGGKGLAMGVRHAWQGWGGVTESDSGSEGYWYAGTETGDARLGELSCVGTRRSEREREKGQYRLAPPGGHQVAGRNGRAVLRSIAR